MLYLNKTGKDYIYYTNNGTKKSVSKDGIVDSEEFSDVFNIPGFIKLNYLPQQSETEKPQKVQPKTILPEYILNDVKNLKTVTTSHENSIIALQNDVTELIKKVTDLMGVLSEKEKEVKSKKTVKDPRDF